MLCSFADMVPVVALFFLEAVNVPVHIVGVPSLFRSILKLLLSIFPSVCEIGQVLKLVFCHMVELGFDLFHE